MYEIPNHDQRLDAPYQRQFDGVVDDAEHVLLTPADCPCDKTSDTPCNICDGGLAVCVRCGRAEAELDEACDDANDDDDLRADDPGLMEPWEDED